MEPRIPRGWENHLHDTRGESMEGDRHVCDKESASHKARLPADGREEDCHRHLGAFEKTDGC